MALSETILARRRTAKDPTSESPAVRGLLIALAAVFLAAFLFLPLVVVFVEGLRQVGGVPTWVVHGDQLNRRDRAYLAWRALSRSPPLRRLLDLLPSALVVRADTFTRVGPFDPTYEVGGDSDWLFRAKDAGVPMAMLPETLLIQRIHAHNQSHATARLRADLLRAARDSIARQRESNTTPEGSSE